MSGLAVGRIVHFQITEERVRPMIITEVIRPLDDEEYPGCVCGTLFLSGSDLDSKGAMYGQAPSPVRSMENVCYSGDNKIGTWHWPQQS